MCIFLGECNGKGFSEIQRISERYKTNSTGDYDTLTIKRKVHPIVYILVTNKYATLKEIREDYTIEEVLDLYEICMCNIYNKRAIIEAANERK